MMAANEYKLSFTASEINEKLRKIDELDIGSNKIYTQNEEPTDAPDGALWVDLDEESPVLKIKNNGAWEEVAGVSGHTHTTSDITDFPTSLPADGGNADTLDGKHADEFVLASDIENFGVEIDATLTQEGQAADAKAVGDALAKKITAPSTATVGQTLVVKTIDDSGAPTEWECVDRADVSGGGGVTSWNDLADKPFGEEIVTEVLLEEKTYEGFVQSSEFGGYITELTPSPFELFVGETYIVSWEDNVHYVTAKDGSVLMEGAVYIGNGSHLQVLEGNNEPFLIGFINGSLLLMAVDSSDSSHKISITKEATVVTPIDEKYFPMDAIDARIEEYISEALGGDY